jgi:energy-coupling factor transporter ATP-binding protein EcfA2
MFLKEVRLKNFKRFTDLTLHIPTPEQSKLVLLIGANGSGKSAIFDAFEYAATHQRVGSTTGFQDTPYYAKNAEEITEIIINDSKNNQYHSRLEGSLNTYHVDKSQGFSAMTFYGRSAIRYLPKLTKTSIGTAIDINKNQDKPAYYIDVDRRFENDLDVLMFTIIQQFFQGINLSAPEQLAKIKGFLDKINHALPRIFGNDLQTSLRFNQILPPADGQPMKILFQKGNSEINYDVLSSGEKEIVNILFNLFVRVPAFKDSVYFFDELDTHLHTSLQYNLLKEIVENWIPDTSQVWIASHSLGFIEYAQKSSTAIILDFDSYDFDMPIVLEPQVNNEVFDIAVPKETLAFLFKDKKKVFCENHNSPLYNSLNIKDLIFLADVDKNNIFLRIEQEEKGFYGLIDRDYLSDAERERMMQRFPNLKILDYYCFENYLWHPDNLSSLGQKFDKTAYINKIRQEKNKSLDKFIYQMRGDRQSYVFFRNEKSYSFQDKEPNDVINLLKSDDFEIFYKVFKMKNQGDLCPIKNLKHEDLVKTEWFIDKIERLFEA